MAKIRLKKIYLLMVFDAIQSKERSIIRKLNQLKKEAREGNTTAEKLDKINDLEIMLARYSAINEVIKKASEKKDGALDEELGPDVIVVSSDNESDDSGYDIYTHLID